MRRSRCSNAAAGASACDAVTVKPSGAAVIESKWLIHTGWSAAVGRRTARLGGRRELGAAVLAAPGARHLAAEVAGHELRAVADAEDRDAQVVDVGIERGAPSTCTDFGPPLRMIPAGAPAAISAAVIVCGTISL